MTILIYSTNASYFVKEDYEISLFPPDSTLWEEVAKERATDKIILASQEPAMFLSAFSQKECSYDFYIMEAKNAEEFAQKLISFNADIAIAATFWTPPYDWLGLQDAMIADILRSHGIKTLCTSQDAQLLCFDKNLFHNFLQNKGVQCVPAVYVHHELYWCERGHKELKTNVYKDYILRQIASMHFPVVIKDTVGLSSYGMEVAVSIKEAIHYLNLGRTKSDRLVEEFIDGTHFGLEIYGSKGRYSITDPFMFSVNRYGITSPKQSIKIGPLKNKDEEYHIKDLKETLLRIATALNLEGVSQVDLIFKENVWYIIEINPRLSGLTRTVCASLDLSVPKLLLNIMEEKSLNIEDASLVCNIKLPLLSKEILESLSKEPHILHLHQLKNLNAKQEREKGYCEMIIGGVKTKESLIEILHSFKEKHADIIEEDFFKRAIKMLEKF